jgi:hypothetical protein
MMINMKNLSWIVVCVILISGCGGDEFQPSSEEQCKVGRFVYKQEAGRDVSYHITYTEEKAINLITDEVFQNDMWQTNATYRHIFRNDSLIVRDFTAFKEGATLLTALTGTNISEVKRYLPGGAVYRWRFDYSKSGQVTVSLEKMNGDAATEESRGIYYLDLNSDVTRLELFGKAANPGGDPVPPDKLEKEFTYDIVINPLKSLALVHFLKPELPDVTFFSMHNRVTEKQAGVTKQYKITYGTDPMPSEVIMPDGVVQKFEYPNCTN